MIISSVTICEYNSIFFICTKKGMTLEWKSCGKNYIMPFLLDLMSHVVTPYFFHFCMVHVLRPCSSSGYEKLTILIQLLSC